MSNYSLEQWTQEWKSVVFLIAEHAPICQKDRNYISGKDECLSQSLTCASQNSIYVIRRTGCHRNYIGSTRMSIRQRCMVRRQQISSPQYREIYLSQHIDEYAERLQKQFVILHFYQLAFWSSTKVSLIYPNI